MQHFIKIVRQGCLILLLLAVLGWHGAAATEQPPPVNDPSSPAALLPSLPLSVLSAEKTPHPSSAPQALGTASSDAIEHLRQTLENDVRRAAFLMDLRALQALSAGGVGAGTTAAAPSSVSPPPTADSGLLPLLSDHIEQMSDQILDAASHMTALGRSSNWVLEQFQPPTRSRWAQAVPPLLLLLALGGAVEFGGNALLLPLRRRVSLWPATAWLVRLTCGVGLVGLRLLPLLGFVVTVRLLPRLGLPAPPDPFSIALFHLVNAHLTARVLRLNMQAALMVRHPHLRLWSLRDETAGYLEIWANRLIQSGVWGYFGVLALQAVGLPETGALILLKLLGLVVASLLLMLVLQNRQAVADLIRQNGDLPEPTSRLGGLRSRLAEIWHILATIYIIGVLVVWLLHIKGGFDYVIRGSGLTLMILVAAHLLSDGVAGLVRRAFRVDEELRERFPYLESRANRYSPLLTALARGAVLVGATLMLLQAWGIQSLGWLTERDGHRLLATVLGVVAVLIGALILWEMVNGMIERYLAATDSDGKKIERSARIRTLLPLMRHIVLVSLVVVVALIILSELGINIAPLLAGAGVIGVAIGFGSQKLVQDIITGAFILFEDTVSVGDAVRIGEHSGFVESLSIRTLRLRDTSGHVHTLPFSSVATITNMTRDYSCTIISIGLSHSCDPDQVITCLKNVAESLLTDPEWSEKVLSGLEQAGMDKITDTSLHFTGRLRTAPAQQWLVGYEFNRRAILALRAANLPIAEPIETVKLVR